MNFIKLGKRYVNLDNVAAILPKEEGLGYTINFIDHHATMDICEMDMADIRRVLEMVSIREAIIDESKCNIGGVEYFIKGANHE